MAKDELKNQKQEPLIYVILGKEPALVNQQYEQLIDKLLKPSERLTGLFVADTEKDMPSQIFDELKTSPFLSGKRVVVIKQADDFITENREILESYFDRPCRTGILILTVSSFASNTKLAKKLNQFGKLISLSEPKRNEIPLRIKQYAKEAHSKTLSNEAAELLIFMTGEQLGQLYAEIDKLALFTADEKNIEAEHIEKLVGKGRLLSIFNAIDTAMTGDIACAAAVLNEVFEQDKNAQFTFIGAFAYHLRRIFNAKVMLEKGVPEKQIIDNFRLWYVKETFFSHLKKIKLLEAGRLISEIARADFEIKTGQVSPQTAAVGLLYKLAVN